jgi:hypothetical protein
VSDQPSAIRAAMSDLSAPIDQLGELLGGCPSGSPDGDMAGALERVAWAQITLANVLRDRAAAAAQQRAPLATRLAQRDPS